MNGPSKPGEFSGKQTFRPGELAVVCRVTVHTLSMWESEGLIPCLRTLGGHRRYLRRDLKWLPEGDPQLLTYRDMAELMAVGSGAVGRWVNTGKLNAVMLPGSYPRLIRSEVAELMVTWGALP